jgi:hypothetical protein
MRLFSRPITGLAVLALAASCGSPQAPTGSGRRLRTEKTMIDRPGGEPIALTSCSEETASTTCFTNRTIIGVSMGASGAGQLGFSHPELFDTVGMLGVPLVDWVWMMRMIERGYLGGFCDMQTILAHKDDMANPNGHAYCGPEQAVVKIEPSGKILEPPQDYNHWYRWIDAGRGGGFGRNKLRDSFQDLALAFGNALYHNPDSPYFPPGVPRALRDMPDAERCAHPLVLKNFKDGRYNPDGAYDVIAFCDTNTNTGDFDQAHPSDRATEILLSVDYNQNGIRDYAEPIIAQAHEPYKDVGTQPNDEYDAETNPAGTAHNWRYDEGEPFDDVGLDGVPNTHDYGEGNGEHDYSPNALNVFAQNPRGLLEAMPAGHLDRMNIYADAGIRDFLESAAGMNWLWGALRLRAGADKAKDYTTFLSLVPGQTDYDYLAVDYSPKGIGKHAYVRYGDPNATEQVVDLGDGNHVGPADQVLERFFTALTFVQSRFLDPDRSVIMNVGNITDLIAPKKFFSKALQEMRDYGVSLPPGYDLPENANERYPVVYFLHGQGMESSSLLAAGILFFGLMAESNEPATMRAHKSDWAKFIMVFPDSTCDPAACKTGNFNANHKGLDGNGPHYMDSLFELMELIERDYRVAPPVEVPKSELEHP